MRRRYSYKYDMIQGIIQYSKVNPSEIFSYLLPRRFRKPRIVFALFLTSCDFAGMPIYYEKGA